MFGGSNLVFDHNYEHDNCSQNLFFKDGDINGATVANNLFVRNSTAPPGGCGTGSWTIQLFDTPNLVIQNNTEWATGSLLRCDAPGFGYTATVDHNVFSQFNNSPSDPCSFSLTSHHNIFGQKPWTFALSSTDAVSSAPVFVSAGTDDYRLATNPNGIGVDWRPADYVYGPR